MRLPVPFLAAIAVASLACAGGARTGPILRIINMLTMMGTKVEEEAKDQGELFDQAMCECQKRQASLKESVNKAQFTTGELKTSIEEKTAAKFELTQEIAGHKANLEAAIKILSEQKGMRSKEKAEHEQQKREQEANIAALGNAAKALEKGLSQQEFLQTRAASLLQGLLLTGKPGQGEDREVLTAFLQQSASADAPVSQDSNEIVGIITQLKEDMEKELQAMVKLETERQSAYEALTQAKAKEKTANEEAIRGKSERLSDATVKLADMTSDVKDTSEGLELNEKALLDLNQDCAKRETDFAAMKKELRAEAIALSEVVKILSEESAMDQFKKAFPVPSLLQVRSTAFRHDSQQMSRLVHGIRIARATVTKPEVRRGTQKGIDEIIRLIDNLISVIAREQKDDQMQTDLCRAELDKNGKRKVELDNAIKATSAAIASLEDDLSQVNQELEDLRDYVEGLDKGVSEATSLREKEHAAHVKVLADHYAANDILEIAKKKLKDFYEKAALLQEEKVDTSTTDTDEDNARGVSTFVQRRSNHRRQPMKAEGGQVIQMMETVQQDLQAESAKAKQEESDAQANYVRELDDAKKQRDKAVKAITSKEEVRAGSQESLKLNKDKKKQHSNDLEETKAILATLNEECDNNIDLRTAARQAEVNKLQSAKAHLASGPLASPVALAQAQSLRGTKHRVRAAAE